MSENLAYVRLVNAQKIRDNLEEESNALETASKLLEKYSREDDRLIPLVIIVQDKLHKAEARLDEVFTEYDRIYNKEHK